MKDASTTDLAAARNEGSGDDGDAVIGAGSNCDPITADSVSRGNSDSPSREQVTANANESCTSTGALGPDNSRRLCRHAVGSRLYYILSWTPPSCRYNPDKPFGFSLYLNLLFSFAACFTVANLYYSYPILNLFARDFNVTYEEASNIPTLAQTGYAAGLLLLCPLGDLVKRRPFVLWLVGFTATAWIGLCVTRSYQVFLGITFLTAMTTVTPQIMLPLVGDMAPPERRSTSLSIVVSGMLLGMLVARVLSGVVTQFIGWRYIYWISFGLQYLILILLWWFMPDYPQTNQTKGVKEFSKTYPRLLWHVVRLPFQFPVLMQACLVGFCTSSCFTSYWTTLTFLLAGAPYYYNSLVIGLFALIGIGSMTWGPIYARLVMEKRQPLFSVILGEVICLIGVIIGTYTGTITVAGPIIQAAAIDIGLQTSQIANRTAIYGCAPKARNRINTSYMVCVFAGQLTGTAVGNAVYARSGWIGSGSTSVGFVGAALVICLLRGPHEPGWIGWRGGSDMKIDPKRLAQTEPRPQPMTNVEDIEKQDDKRDSALSSLSSTGSVTGVSSNFEREPSAEGTGDRSFKKDIDV